MTESLMTDQAANPTEGTAASQTAASEQPTGSEQAVNQQQATDGQEQQSSQDGTDAGKTESGEDGKPEGAPEKYEFKATDGKEFDAEILNNFSDIAKELNLSQDAAQKLLDKMGPSIEARQMEQIETLRTEWAEAAQNDKEFGGEKLQENLSVAKKALDQFGTPELRALLNESGLGNNPEVIRFMFRAGKAISQDTYVGSTTGANPKGGPKGFNDMASELYRNQQT